MAAFMRLESARRRMDGDAFTPSPVIERLVLQVIGGWELLKAEVNFHSFTAAGFGADWNSENSAKAMREIAEARRVSHPHQEFAQRPMTSTLCVDDSRTLRRSGTRSASGRIARSISCALVRRRHLVGSAAMRSASRGVTNGGHSSRFTRTRSLSRNCA